MHVLNFNISDNSLYTKNDSERRTVFQPILLSMFYDIIDFKVIYFAIKSYLYCWCNSITNNRTYKHFNFRIVYVFLNCVEKIFHWVK